MITLPSPDEAKAMARRLRSALADRDIELGHARTLELVAAAYGLADWNTLAALGRPRDAPPAVPLLRMLDADRSIRFYQDLLGWRVTPGEGPADQMSVHTPSGAVLQLSDRADEAAPGACVILTVPDVAALAAQLGAVWPGVAPQAQTGPSGRTLTVFDPARNRLVFCEPGAHLAPGDELPPIVHEFTMPEPPEAAFDRFVTFGWWHDHGRAEGAPTGIRDGEIVFDNPQGSLSIGRVTAWDPGRRYAQTFTLAQDPAHPTWLEVLFRGDHDFTRVRFAHGGWAQGNADRRDHFTDWPALLAPLGQMDSGR